MHKILRHVPESRRKERGRVRRRRERRRFRTRPVNVSKKQVVGNGKGPNFTKWLPLLNLLWSVPMLKIWTKVIRREGEKRKNKGLKGRKRWDKFEEKKER